MNILEIDYRYGWVSSIVEALESGLMDIARRGEHEDWFDGLWQMEYAESIYGIAFVSAQTYLLGTTRDINKIREDKGKQALNKLTYYSDDFQFLPKQLSRARLIVTTHGLEASTKVRTGVPIKAANV